MSSEQPKVPPRPSRSQEKAADPMSNIPHIPPRPQRRTDRSLSPNREAFTRSPLNELPTPSQNGHLYSERNLSVQDLPARPPSVSLPSIGQEGMEYANLEDAEASEEEQHRNISPDLPMHAPKASVPQSTAKSRIQTVTRTDSSQAAAVGIGKADPELHPLRAKASFNRSNLSLSQEQGQEEQEHGIPEIGLQVPMLKYAGDVQAPTPAPSAQGGAGGIGFADASQRNHHRKRSSRQEFGPPGSYGMHGHRQDPRDQFEKAWYARHPEELAKEHRPYDPGHAPGDWALSSDDLNKLVLQSGHRGLGMGTSPGAIGTPDEQIGYMASEEYASRMNSPKPRPASMSGLAKRPSSGQLPHVESPLKKDAFNLGETLKPPTNDDAVEESDAEPDVIHIDPPAHRHSKFHRGEHDAPTEDLGPEGGNTDGQGGWIVENGYGVPILASDQVDPAAEYLQPAISPEQERKGQDYYSSAYDSDSSAHAPSHRRSNEKLRTGSGGELSRFKSREAAAPSGAGTPLAEIEEYEPLFPEEDDKKPLTHADKLMRPELARHHFPSQDVWEDAPESLQYETTVSGPQEPEDLATSQELKPTSTFETPEQEQARKEGAERADFLSEETQRMARSHFKPGVADEMSRPDYRHRFPSRDIWEDTPDSLQLETTVQTPQTEEQDISSPADAKSPQEYGREFVRPEIPSRPARSSKLSEVSGPTFESPEKEQARKEGNIPSDRAQFLPEETKNLAKGQPQIPARPTANKPKPQVPARPGKAERSGSQEGAPLEKVISPPALKPKPAVPSSKFAALKAGFLNDLNSRLGMGPQAPPKPAAAEEAPAQEKAPLADARKGRARGPARRKPVAEAAATTTTSTSSASTFSIGTTFTVFQINDEGSLSVPTSELSPEIAESAQELEKIAAANTTGAAPATALESEKAALSGFTEEAIGHQGDTPEPKLSLATMERAKAIQPEFEAALAQSEGKSTSEDVPVAGEAVSSADKPEVHGSDKPVMTDQSVQTGQQDIEIKSPTGEHEKMTLVLGGRAPNEGNVVVKEDGEQILGDMDERHRTATTGHGM